MDVNALVNADHTGTVQLILPYEDQIFNKAEVLMDSWRKKKSTLLKWRLFNWFCLIMYSGSWR